MTNIQKRASAVPGNEIIKLHVFWQNEFISINSYSTTCDIDYISSLVFRNTCVKILHKPNASQFTFV